MSASTQDCPASKELETQSGWLFVTLECWIDGTLKFAREIESKQLRLRKLTRWQRKNASRNGRPPTPDQISSNDLRGMRGLRFSRP